MAVEDRADDDWGEERAMKKIAKIFFEEKDRVRGLRKAKNAEKMGKRGCFAINFDTV